jgi:hypothetical protein
VESLASDFLMPLLEEEEAEEAEEESFSFQPFFSFASSISICSCLHSLLQKGVFPLQDFP